MSEFTGPAMEREKDNPILIKKKFRVGVYMFIIYALIYFGFVGINTVDPSIMDTVVIFGLNLAVVYGFGLIILAILLGLIYNHICSKFEKTFELKEQKEELMINDKNEIKAERDEK